VTEAIKLFSILKLKRRCENMDMMNISTSMWQGPTQTDPYGLQNQAEMKHTICHKLKGFSSEI